MKILSLLLLLALASCMPTVRGDIANLRAEIRSLQNSVPPEAPLWVFEGPDRFDRFIEDYSSHLPDFIYLHVLKKLHEMGQADADSLLEGSFNLEACIRDPDAFRGKTWRIQGLIARFNAEQIDDDRCPVRQIHEGILFNDAGKPILFHVVQKPDVLTLEKDQVEINGIFVKMISYTARNGQHVEAPLFIGRRLRRLL